MSVFRHIRTQEMWLVGQETAAASSPGGVGECKPTLWSSAPQGRMPAHIGRYEVEAETGHGTLVRVFRAFDRNIGRPITLKVLTDVTNGALLERFRREVVNAATVRNVSMAAIYELGEHAGLPFVAMQHFGDEDLRRAIQTQRRLTLFQKMLMMWHAAEGVRAAHRSGLSYVGVRPSAIALSNDGCTTIQDFGIVRLTGGPQDEGVSYASPEELAADFSPDLLCDVFAFGTVYYEVLTGRHPFLVGSSSEAKIDILHHEPAPLRDLMPECPEALARLVYRALDKHRELRYQSLDDIQYDAAPILRELKRTRATVLLADARRLMGAQELDDAQGVVRAVLELDPDNRKALRLHTVVHGLLRRRRVRARLVPLLRQADEEADTRCFDRAVEILESALRIDGANLEVKNRLEQMRSRLEQSQRSAQLVAEARQLLDQQCLTEAHGKATQALERDPTSVEATELLHAIGEAVKRQEKEARVEQELAKVKSLLLLQSFDDATFILAALRAECPDFPLIDYWVAHVRTQQADAERQTRLQEQLAEARSLLTQQQYAEALAKLETLSTEFPEEDQVSDLLLQARKAMERANGVAQAMAQCDQLRCEEQFDKALEVLDSALATYAAEPAILTRRREVEEEARQFKYEAAVRPVLDEAEWLLEQDRPDLAVQLLRERSADFLDQPNYRSRIETIEEMLPGWERHRLIQDFLGRIAVLEQQQQWPVALTVLEEALEACPASVELLEAAERLRSLLRERERQKKLTSRLEMIGKKVTAQAWPQALALTEAAKTEFPDQPELQHLLEEVRSGLRRSECESIIAEVRQHLADGETKQAEDILRNGMASLGEEPALEALREELEGAKEYRDEWRTAQIFFARRQFREAEQILVRLAVQNRPDVEALLAAVREARSAREEEQFYKDGREKALKLIQQHLFEQAADLLCNLLALFPGDPFLERDLRCAQRRDQDLHEDTIPASEKLGEPEPCELQAEPRCQRPTFQLVETQSPMAAPHVRWAVIATAALFLLVSAGAAVWKFSRNEFPTPGRTPLTPDSAQLPVTREAQGRVATPAAPAPSSVVVGSGKPLTKTDQAASHPPFNHFSTLRGPDAAPIQAPLIRRPPGTVSGRDAPRLPEDVLGPDFPQRPTSERQNEGRAAIAAAAPSRGGNFQKLKFLSGPSPVIPPLARELGIHGDVKLKATVDRRGTVTNVTVLSGHPLLVSAATNAVRKWRFQPATLNGQPLEISIPIHLTLEAGRR